jgi:hypothetical protein
MTHSPFENWILNDTQLSCSQVQELNEHLKTCTKCSCLYNNWKSVNVVLKKAPMVSPQPGFTARWQASLEERRLKQQHKQIKLFFIIAGGANILAVLGLLGILLANGNWFNLLIKGLQTITTLIIWITQMQRYVISLLHILPPFLPIFLWMLFTTILSVVTIIWVATLWRITIKGVQVK